MRKTRFMTAAICAVMLSAMTAFQAYCDTSAASASELTSAAETYVSETLQEVDSTSETDTVYNVSGTDTASTSGSSALDTSDLFSSRDLEQTADLTGAEKITVNDGETYTISKEGVYVVTGSASNAQILISAGDEDKVQLVLDDVSITNESTPCIYVQNADKVFVTTTDSENTLTVSGAFTADGDTNTDAAIFSRDDLVVNGTGTLNISSSENGISSKDDLKSPAARSISPVQLTPLKPTNPSWWRTAQSISSLTRMVCTQRTTKTILSVTSISQAVQ